MKDNVIELFGLDEKKVEVSNEQLDIYNNNEAEIDTVKVFSSGELFGDIMNKLIAKKEQNIEYINLDNILIEDLQNDDILLSEINLVLLVAEYDDVEERAKLEYVMKQARAIAAKTILVFNMLGDIDNDLIKGLSTKVDMVLPIIDKEVQQYEKNIISTLNQQNIKKSLGNMCISTVYEFLSEGSELIASIDRQDIYNAGKGMAYVGSALASGEKRAEKAVSLALSNRYSLKNYKDCETLLINFSGSSDLLLFEVNEGAQVVLDNYDEDKNVVVGVSIDESLEDNVKVSIVGV